MRKIKIIFGIVFLCGILCSQQAVAQEFRNRALLICKFADHIEWPVKDSQITIGVVGKTKVYQQLEYFAKFKDNINIVKIKSLQDVHNCDIVYLPKSKIDQLSIYENAIGSESTLLISENFGMSDMNSDIGFYNLYNGKLWYHIKEHDLKAKNLVPDSKLIALGKIM